MNHNHKKSVKPLLRIRIYDNVTILHRDQKGS